MRTSMFLTLAASLCLPTLAAADSDSLHQEAVRRREQLPAAVVRSMHQHAGDYPIIGMSEIRIKGLPALYEIEYRARGSKHELTLRPNGDVVGTESMDRGTGSRRVSLHDVTTREIATSEFETLPAPARNVLLKVQSRRDMVGMTEFSFEGMIALYEVKLSHPGDRSASVRTLASSAQTDDSGPTLFIYPTGATGWRQDEISERGLTLDEVPEVVADALRRMLGGADPSEIEEVRIEGVPVLYEVEVDRADQEQEFAVLPDGTPLQQEEDAEGADEDDHDEDDGDELNEVEIEYDDLPEEVARTLDKQLRGSTLRELEAVYYEGALVLYEAEVVMGRDMEFEILIYPSGTLAEIHKAEDSPNEPDDGD